MNVNIYVIENSLNNKLYVGRTSQSLKIRLKNHRACARRFLRDNTAKTTPFQKEMAKLGVENFSIRLLEKCSEALANERESFWTRELNSLAPNGYNYNLGDNQLSKMSDLKGKTFGKLTVIGLDYVKGASFWKCRCECGNIVTVKGAKLINGHTKSCGCLCKDRVAKSNHNRCIHCYINGELVNLKDYCMKNGISYNMLWQRVHKFNYTLTKALTTPSRNFKGFPLESVKEVV